MIFHKDAEDSLFVCPECDFHLKVSAEIRFQQLFDEGSITYIDCPDVPKDPLKFTDKKAYSDRLKAAQSKTNLNDAVRTAVGKSKGKNLVIACMDFSFIGGSMGSVVGEKIARAADHALHNNLPFMIISKSGGARMMEAAFSLMQMAKTSAKLALLNKAKLPYISILTHPTTGGVTASFAMLGDFNIAEPKALIGFAGPRVIKETIGRDLPKGFQSSEFLVEHGFLDFIVDRNDIKNKLNTLIKLIKQKKK